MGDYGEVKQGQEDEVIVAKSSTMPFPSMNPVSETDSQNSDKQDKVNNHVSKQSGEFPVIAETPKSVLNDLKQTNKSASHANLSIEQD